MGWFDSDKILVNVLANKISDARVTPIRNAAVSAVSRGESVADNVLAGMVNGLGARVQRYWNYGEKHFIDGLPTIALGATSNYVADTPVSGNFEGTTYPIVIIRKNRQFITKELDKERWQSSKRCLKRVTLNMDNIIRNIQETERTDEDGNPIDGNPAANLDDIFFLFGMDLYTTEPKGAEYLFDFFDYIRQDVLIDEEEFYLIIDLWSAGGSGYQYPHTNTVRFQTAEDQYDVQIQFDYMSIEEYAGRLVHPVTGKAESYTEMDEGRTILHTNVDTGRMWYQQTSIVVLHKQVEENVFHKIYVHGLTHRTTVEAYGEDNIVLRTIGEYEDKGTGTFEQYHGRTVGDPEYGRSGMYFPIIKEILEKSRTTQEEVIMAESMLLIMHAADKVSLEWYQQRWFRIILVILVAVVTYFSVGYLAAKGVALIESLTALAMSTAIGILVEYIAKEIGGDLGLILAAAAAIFAVSKGDFTKVGNLFPHAAEILQTTIVVTQVANANLKVEQEQLAEEAEDFENLYQDRIDEIRDVYNLIGAATNNDFDVFDIIANNENAFTQATPDDYYAMAKTTNVASIVKEAVSTYHSNMKRLPEYKYQPA